MFRKSLPWLLLAVACLGAVVYSWQVFPQAFPIVNVELTMNRSVALDSARARAERLGLGPDAFSQAAAFRTDVATALVLAVALGWTALLQRRQRSAAASSSPEAPPRPDSVTPAP